jgi:hypothetical protein
LWQELVELDWIAVEELAGSFQAALVAAAGDFGDDSQTGRAAGPGDELLF